MPNITHKGNGVWSEYLIGKRTGKHLHGTLSTREDSTNLNLKETDCTDKKRSQLGSWVHLLVSE